MFNDSVEEKMLSVPFIDLMQRNHFIRESAFNYTLLFPMLSRAVGPIDGKIDKVNFKEIIRFRIVKTRFILKVRWSGLPSGKLEYHDPLQHL